MCLPKAPDPPDLSDLQTTTVQAPDPTDPTEQPPSVLAPYTPPPPPPVPQVNTPPVTPALPPIPVTPAGAPPPTLVGAESIEESGGVRGAKTAREIARQQAKGAKGTRIKKNQRRDDQLAIPEGNLGGQPSGSTGVGVNTPR